MGALRHLTPAQLADLERRQRDGRVDKAPMTNEERRQAGLMDRQQAAEHERLADLPISRPAERSRRANPDSRWLIGESA